MTAVPLVHKFCSRRIVKQLLPCFFEAAIYWRWQKSHPSAVSTSAAFDDSGRAISSSWYGTPLSLLLFLKLHKAHDAPIIRAIRKAKLRKRRFEGSSTSFDFEGSLTSFDFDGSESSFEFDGSVERVNQ
nr:hypothetical protein [Tanacetum cinerariifolium]